MTYGQPNDRRGDRSQSYSPAKHPKGKGGRFVKKSTLPVPVKGEGRSCFGILWFTTLKDAQTYGEAVKHQTYNGGFMHGKSCGRESAFDYTDTERGPLYAVTTS